MRIAIDPVAGLALAGPLSALTSLLWPVIGLLKGLTAAAKSLDNPCGIAFSGVGDAAEVGEPEERAGDGSDEQVQYQRGTQPGHRA